MEFRTDMKKRYLIISVAIGAIGALAVGIVSCSHHSSPMHTIGTVSATPAEVPAGSLTPVTITAIITDPSLITSSVQLLRLGSGSQSTDLGLLQSTGSSSYTIQITMNEPSPDQARFAVSASFANGSSPVVSNPVSVISLATPAKFRADPGPLSLGGPVSFDNFGGAYEQGGVIPAGGATINATVMPLPTGPLADYISSAELQGALIQGTSSSSVGGTSCLAVNYLDIFTANLSYSNQAVYCPSEDLLYKFFLSYNSGDPNASQYEAAFMQVVNSAALKP